MNDGESTATRAMGLRLREWRGSKGWRSLDEFAAALAAAGYAVSAVSLGRYELGKRKMDADLLYALANAGCDLNWLISGISGDSFGQPIALESKPAELDEDLLRHIVEMIESWLSRRAASLPPAKKAELISEAYALCISEAEGDEAAARIVPRLLRLVA